MHLRERILAVIASKRVESGRAWSTKAGLSPTHLGTILTRLGRDPGADIERGTLAQLAAAAEISEAWLSIGEGRMISDDPLTTEALLHLLRERDVEIATLKRRIDALLSPPETHRTKSGKIQEPVDEIGHIVKSFQDKKRPKRLTK